MGPRARIPADVDAPDRVLFGLTARQVAVVAAVVAPVYLGWRLLQGRLPDLVLLTAAAPVAALARRAGDRPARRDRTRRLAPGRHPAPATAASSGAERGVWRGGAAAPEADYRNRLQGNGGAAAASSGVDQR